MDKYEYRVKTEQMLEYMEKKQYKKAMEIADTIDWRRVKNAAMLNSVSEIYEFNGEFQKSRDILFVAYDRSPASRKIVYRLGTLALKVNDTEEASDCYEEFVKLAPKDPNQFILKYKILKARRAPVPEQIEALEDFKKAEYVEKWAYELAKLYHEAGMTAECLEECDDLILWFSEGQYVYQAMELKMKYKPLTPLQQEKYDNRYVEKKEQYTRTGSVPALKSRQEELRTEVEKEEPEPEEEEEVQEKPEKESQLFAKGRTGRLYGLFRKKSIREVHPEEAEETETPETGTAAEDEEAQASEIEPVTQENVKEEPVLAEEKNTADEPAMHKTRKVMSDSPIRKTVKGATLAEALANGVAVANGLDIEEKASTKRDEDMRITGQMKIEEILQEWEAKQKANAQAIQSQKKRDEERMAQKRKEAQRRREEEARRIEEQQRAAEEARRIEQMKAAEEARRLAEQRAEEERRLAELKAEEEKRLAAEKEAEEERLLERLAAGKALEAQRAKEARLKQEEAAHKEEEILEEEEALQEEEIPEEEALQEERIPEEEEALQEEEIPEEEEALQEEEIPEEILQEKVIPEEEPEIRSEDVPLTEDIKEPSVKPARKKAAAKPKKPVKTPEKAADTKKKTDLSTTAALKAIAKAERAAAESARIQKETGEPLEKTAETKRVRSGMTADLKQLMAELERTEGMLYTPAGTGFEENSASEPEYEDDNYEESEYETEDYDDDDFGEPDYDESEYEESEYEESDYEELDYEESDYEESDYDDDYDDYDDDGEEDYDDDGEDDDDGEEDYDDDDYDEEDYDEDDLESDDVEKTDAQEKEEKPKSTVEDLVIEEPTEEEIQKRIKKGKGGVPFDTGFVVTGRYDLSATSEIGLKAGLTEEQKKLFSYFVPVRGMSEQIVEVLDNDRREQREGTSRTGNILVVGRKGTGKTVLAVDIVKVIQKQRNLKQGKVAIVTGESLNKKEISSIIQKLKGGAMIIEKAGSLNSRTVKELNMLMEKKTGELLFVLEDQRKPLERLFTANPDFRKKFTSKLELPVFINDELVTFGQTYAKENGYKLDEMGILALYSRIDVMQREDHAVTVAEVKEIMDEAIEHSQKANVKHLARRVFGKGTDDSDRIILKEEDFKI